MEGRERLTRDSVILCLEGHREEIIDPAAMDHAAWQQGQQGQYVIITSEDSMALWNDVLMCLLRHLSALYLSMSGGSLCPSISLQFGFTAR